MIHLYTHVVPHIIAWAPRPSASGLRPARLCRALSHNFVTRTLAQNCHCEFCCPNSGQLLNTATIDKVRSKKWPGVSLYLDELLD